MIYVLFLFGAGSVWCGLLGKTKYKHDEALLAIYTLVGFLVMAGATYFQTKGF